MSKVLNGTEILEMAPDGDSSRISRSRKESCSKPTVTSTNSVKLMSLSIVSVWVNVSGSPPGSGVGNGYLKQF